MEKEEENKNLFQDGILSDSTVHSVFITIYVNQWKDYLDNIIELCGNFPDIIQYINQIYNENQKNNHIIGIIGMNSELTKKIFEPNEPKHLRDYITLKGPGGELPFTGGDIFIHIKCNRMDLCFLSQKILLESFVKRGIFFNSHIIYGFSYLVGTNGLGRDLTGFEDGTQNPKKFDKKLKTAIIDSNQDFNHEGGSFVITQQWVHNLEKFEALPKNLQEEVFGRTKDESKKLKDLPINSHVARMEFINEKGEEIKILRHSMPYTTSKESGLFFIAYANDPIKFDTMLKRMVGLEPLMKVTTKSKKENVTNISDQLLNFSQCISGQYYYVPSKKELENFKQKSKL